ncbi:MAG: tRNA (adenosine(37)-N6)-dimethylallyltransferase MiaA [Chloroflexota bacterium]|nr:MAG: tRNA (adenosine(37)-N6)-dimethylallyltransferase MiaA [Anaerolineaceae bacterium 4572_5.2]RLD04581.1 MAG: tRNA (adenosine(37)-N6)-dimethylallyltransferase MiaA [Chloroflexota bacterium]
MTPKLKKNIPLIVILGPTAVGKTELSIQLAERWGGEIVSADSRLFYKGMDIGTAKPTPTERARVPHHLIDVANPDEVWSLALYLQEAQKIIYEIHQRGNLPFLVGGTGQYIQALVEGWRIPRVEPDPALREVLRAWAEELGPEGLRARLAVLDPDAAAGIDGPNIRRMIRALEVILRSGELFSTQKGQGPTPYHVLRLGLTRPRQELYERIDLRIQNMLKDGFIEEVKALLAKGYSPKLPPLSAIGYRQIIHYLNEVITLEEAVRQMESRTRKFVRRQANWFQADDPKIHWFRVSKNTLTEIEHEIKDFLGNI